MSISEDFDLSSIDDGQDFGKTLRSLERTMNLHLDTLRQRRRADLERLEAAASSPVPPQPPPPPAPPQPIVRTYSSMKKDGASGSKPGPTRADKVTVRLRIILLKVGDIDTLRDKFTADAFIQAKWREPLMDGKLNLKSDPIDWETYWNPRLSMENQLGEPKESVWHAVVFDASGQATVCEKRRIHGSFMEFMELYEFPFDNQDLTVTVTTDRDESELELVEDPKEKCSLNVDSFVDEQEWSIHRHITVWQKLRLDSAKNSTKKHPSLSAAAHASRRPQFFIWNVFLVMCLICSLSFTTFAVQLNMPQNRLQLTFILLLTTISFKFIVNQSLPMIAYLTFLDKYILGSMSILATTCVWHAVVSFVYSRNQCIGNTSLRLADLIAFGILASIYVAFHVIFFCMFGCRMRQSGSNDKQQLGSFTAEEVNEGFEEYDSDAGGPDLMMTNKDWRENRGTIGVQSNGSTQHEVIQTLAGLDS